MVKKEKQYALIIMDTFKGQDNNRLRELCPEIYYGVIIVPHDLITNSSP